MVLGQTGRSFPTKNGTVQFGTIHSTSNLTPKCIFFNSLFFRMAEVAQPEVTPEAQEEPEVPEEEEIVPINVPILKLIKQQQMEHGLRHRDYNQYRRYCTNRARRLRRFLNFKLGEKRKVTPRKITPWEIKQNVQFIILMIINIEVQSDPRDMRHASLL